MKPVDASSHTNMVNVGAARHLTVQVILRLKVDIFCIKGFLGCVLWLWYESQKHEMSPSRWVEAKMWVTWELKDLRIQGTSNYDVN